MVRLLQKRTEGRNILSIFAIATLGLHLLTLLFLIFQGFTIRQLSFKKSPTFIQLVDGRPAPAPDNLEREPGAIQDFVIKMMELMFNWSGTLPPQNIEQATSLTLDSGIVVKTKGGSKKVATSSWVASFAISEDFRGGFLAKIAEITPPEVFSTNLKQGIAAQLIIKRIYPPVKIEQGKWRVSMVADLVQVRRADSNKIIIPFNKDFIVRAVDTFEYPLPNETTDRQRAVYSIRAQKLEILEIRELCLTDKYNDVLEDNLNRCGN